MSLWEVLRVEILIFETHLCLPFCTTLLRDGKGPFGHDAQQYPVARWITSGVTGSILGVVVVFLVYSKFVPFIYAINSE